MRYASSWLAVDLIAALPIDAIVGAVLEDEWVDLGISVNVVDMLTLLRLLRALRLTRSEADGTSGADLVHVVRFMAAFLLLAHWLGLVWYEISIKPLESKLEIQHLHAWHWNEVNNTGYAVAVRYTCSLYWSLSIMTNLKGLPAHESRQCLHEDALVTNPLLERIYAICVFVVGAVCFSVIYGNIAQCVSVPPQPRPPPLPSHPRPSTPPLPPLPPSRSGSCKTCTRRACATASGWAS